MDLLEKIDNKLDKLSEDVVAIRIEHAEQTGFISQNTKDLTEHIEGVQQNRTRIINLEKKEAQIGMIWKVILGLSTLVGITIGISRII